ncbi:PREDICTED: molybdopterin synthase catalytic subunit-like [Condylura cristata]|uniref:molybdopterin synthase catalytic subunit-like n=1 Tax=Condylura cristata TaxID=143302 RepID=UPI0003346FB1|nr:PREDICTED: molybdopterin synthase catalytic subunit-like [Condylura cristata]
MSSLEINPSCFKQETKFPLSPQLVEDSSAFEPLGKVVNEAEEKSKDIVKFTTKKLPVDDVSKLVISPLCGPRSLFVGTTGNKFEGKKVISLKYEAYLPMADNEIRNFCSNMRQKRQVTLIAMFHRLGLVPVSEASLIIALSSVHRGSNLKADSYAIDTLKAKVPIWRKKMYEESSSSRERNKEWFPCYQQWGLYPDQDNLNKSDCHSKYLRNQLNLPISWQGGLRPIHHLVSVSSSVSGHLPGMIKTFYMPLSQRATTFPGGSLPFDSPLKGLWFTFGTGAGPVFICVRECMLS